VAVKHFFTESSSALVFWYTTGTQHKKRVPVAEGASSQVKITMAADRVNLKVTLWSKVEGQLEKEECRRMLASTDSFIGLMEQLESAFPVLNSWSCKLQWHDGDDAITVASDEELSIAFDTMEGPPYQFDIIVEYSMEKKSGSAGKTPFTWSNTVKHQYLDVVNNGQDLRYNSQRLQKTTALATWPLNTGSNFVFEILIVDSGDNHQIGVGVTRIPCNLDKFVGWEQGSLGYHGDDGGIFFESGTKMEESSKNHEYRTGDVIRVSFDAQRSTLYFHKNKEVVRNIQLKPHHLSQPLYAAVSMCSPGAAVRALHMSPPL